MSKNEPKTKKTKAKASDYINSIDDKERKRDAKIIHKLMRDITKKKAQMWGENIVGYGTYHYKYGSGREGDWMMTGWSNRKASLTLYIMPGYQFDDMAILLKKLGPHKLGRSCLYIKNLDEIHIPTLERIIKTGFSYMENKYKK